MRVFISYSRRNRATAAKFARWLTKQGYEVWWDYDLLGGVDFGEQIEQQIKASDVVIVIWSATAAKSRHVIDEADMGQEAGKLLTTHVPRFNIKHIPLGFRRLQSLPVGDRDRILLSLDRFKARRTTTRRKRSASDAIQAANC